MNRIATIIIISAAAISTAWAAKTNPEAATLRKAQNGDAAAQNTVGEWYYTGSGGMKQDYQAALQWWAAAAKQGHVAAIGNMGRCYRYGHGTERDSVRAIRLLQKSIKEGNDSLFASSLEAAKKGAVFDNVLLALCYQNGSGVKRNKDKAAEYFEAAATRHSSDAQRELGLLLLNSQLEEEAAEWFLKGAEQGDVSSTYFCGMMRMNGLGVARDTVAGLSYLERAAEAGFPQAYFDLSQRYEQGNGVERDSLKARSYLLKAAIKGSGRAQWKYACRLRDVKKSYYLAFRWMARTLNDGHEASFRQTYCNPKQPDTTAFFDYLKGVALFNRNEFDKALDCFNRMVAKNEPEGLTMKGLTLIMKQADGNDIDSTAMEAGMAYLQTAAQKDPLASFAIYQIQRSMKVNQTDDLLRKAAEAGLPPALCYLGLLRYREKDYDEAVACFRRVDDQGLLQTEAAEAYADCLRNGLGGLNPDAEEAQAVLDRATHDNFSDKLCNLIYDTWLKD